MREMESLPHHPDLSKDYPLCTPLLTSSNDLSTLVHALLQEITSSQRLGNLRHIIITPTNVIKNFIIQIIKKEWGAFCGVRFLSLPQGVQHLIKISVDQDVQFPHYHTLMLFLQEALGEDDIDDEVKRYINKDCHRRLSLAKTLSHIFLFYGLYGAPLLSEWLHRGGWQQRLFQKAADHWLFPYQFASFQPPLRVVTQFHLFALPTMPQLFCHFFEKVNARIYHRLPTPHYVGDLLTDPHLSRLDRKWQKLSVTQSERIQFHDLAKEPNRLFANWSKAALPYARWIQEREGKELFLMPDGDTILQQHRKNLYKLRISSVLPKEGDTSIEIHGAPSHFREVEVIFERLCDLFSSDRTLKSSDVQFFAPCLDEYVPAIEFIFGREDSPFGYSLSGVTDLNPAHPRVAIRHLFRLVHSRLTLEELFEFLHSSAVKKPALLDDVTLKTFASLFKKKHVHWGYDGAMRREILGSDDVSEQGTFKDAFEKILHELAFLSSPLEFSNVEALGELIIFLEELVITLRDCKERSRTIGAWIDDLCAIIETYFVASDERNQVIKELVKLSYLDAILQQPLLFSPLLTILEEITTVKETSLIDARRPPISMHSIEEGSITSPRITVILGVDEETFPRQEQRCSLNELRRQPGCDAYPTKGEKDRLFLLEALAHTRETLLLSYTNINPQDGKQRQTSLLVDELRSMTPGLSIVNHPATPFAKSALQRPTLLPLTRKLAKAHYDLPHKPQIATSTKYPLPEAIDLSYLCQLAAHPLRFFLQKRCGIYLDQGDEESERKMREFMLSFQSRATIRKKAYLQSREELLKELSYQSLLPTTLFSIAATQEVEEEIDEADQHLSSFQLLRDDIVTILLDPAVEKPLKLSESEYLHPSLFIGNTMIYGKIDYLTPQGLLCFGDNSIASIWKVWPKLLATDLLQEWEFPTTLLFTKGGEKLPLALKNSTASLQRFLEYAEVAYNTPSPLMPDLLKNYTSRCGKPLSGGLFKDPYLDLLSPDWSHDWKPYFEEVYEIV